MATPKSYFCEQYVTQTITWQRTSIKNQNYEFVIKEGGVGRSTRTSVQWKEVGSSVMVEMGNVRCLQ